MFYHSQREGHSNDIYLTHRLTLVFQVSLYKLKFLRSNDHHLAQLRVNNTRDPHVAFHFIIELS
jgi:hypothetical protein